MTILPGQIIIVEGSRHAELTNGMEGVVEREMDGGYAAVFQIKGRPLTAWVEREHCQLVEKPDLHITIP